MGDVDFKVILQRAERGETVAVLAAVDQDGRLATRASTHWHTNTLLQAACARGHIELARGLLARGASVGARDGIGRDATWYALADGNVDLVTLLLDHGGDACTEDGGGQTAFWEAGRRGHLAVCLLLLSRGADFISVWRGSTALERCGYEGTALRLYAGNIHPPLSPEVLAEHHSALLAAWHAGPHPSQVLRRANECWARRWPMMNFMTGCRFRPLAGRQGWVPPEGLSLAQRESAQRENVRQWTFISFVTGYRFRPLADKQGWIPPEGLSLEQRERARRRTLVFSSDVLLRLIVSFL